MGEGILMSSPDTIQGTADEDDDEYDSEEESEHGKEDSEESQVVEAKSAKLSRGGLK